ncbi:MAG TPA: hypothetical protein VGP62_12180 [Bryobacteraceae bacterium]|jgi:hypothetical protein|nr:hypothetical protein [Bryobacteraceae bacterium]
MSREHRPLGIECIRGRKRVKSSHLTRPSSPPQKEASKPPKKDDKKDEKKQ